MTRSRKRLALPAAFALIAALLQPREAATASFDDSIYAAKQAVADLFGGLFSSFSTSPVDAVTPPTPMMLIHGIQSKTGSHFWAHLSDAGYELTEISTSVGIIPDVKMTFQIVRQMSEADRNALERKLEIDDMKVSGVMAAIQRRIVRTLLEVSDVNDMRVGKLVIGILPLPSAEFTIEPQDAPLSEEHDALYRAIMNKAGPPRKDTHQKPLENAKPEETRTE